MSARAQARVFVIDRGLEELDKRLRGTLNADEQQKANRYVHEADRILSRLGRAMCRRALAHVLGGTIAPTAFAFGEGTFGKPFVTGPKEARHLAFNLSHTAGLLACIVTENTAVGVDAESAGRVVEYGELAKQFFSAIEAERVGAASGVEQHRLFYDIWTLKEAYIKGRGLGVSLDLASFAVDVDRRTRSLKFSPPTEPPDDEWTFGLYDLTPTHRLAVAAQAPSIVVQATRLNTDASMVSLPFVPVAATPGLSTH